VPAHDQESSDALDGGLHTRDHDEHEVPRQPVGDHAGRERHDRRGGLPAREDDADSGRRVVGDVQDRERERDVRDTVADGGDRRRGEDEAEVALGEGAEACAQITLRLGQGPGPPRGRRR
jgi:hypothetical protein